jgi:hypothetical protein
MPFRKTSSVEILGVLNRGSWKKSAKKSVQSFYMDSGVNASLDLEERLDAVADVYKISRDPSNYLLIPARANSVGRFNANLDGWTYDETVAFRPELGCRTYATYNNKPHFVEHQASRYEVARGMILDSHLNMENPADDEVKRAVAEAIGQTPDKDVFTEVILAVDQTKDPSLAEAYKCGAIDTFSMGADVESTVCNICGKVATTMWDFCPHVRDKHKKISYKMDDGSYRVAGELCQGTIFQELSVVSDPADKSAVIQEGLLEIASRAASAGISNNELQEIISFTARYARDLPDTLAMVINQFLTRELSNE